MVGAGTPHRPHGFLRALESALEVSGKMQEPSILDSFSFDRLTHEQKDIDDMMKRAAKLLGRDK